MRLAACLGFPLHIIAPTSFSMDDRALKRAGMDYADKAATQKHTDFDAFAQSITPGARLVITSTKAAKPFTDFTFETSDIIVMGRESAGLPQWLHERADARLLIPMVKDARSINMALAASMVIGEALRQTGGFAHPASTAQAAAATNETAA